MTRSSRFHLRALAAGYQAMAADEQREREADEWVEVTFLDLDDETWPTGSPPPPASAAPSPR